MDKPDAEKKIAEILAELEKDKNCLVDSIEINEVDCTTYSSKTKEAIRNISINMRHFSKFLNLDRDV